MLAAALMLGSQPVPAEPVDFSIPAGDAAETLKNFGAQARLQLLFVNEAVERHATQAVSGELEPRDALERLLAGTGLTFEFVNERTVAIRAAVTTSRAGAIPQGKVALERLARVQAPTADRAEDEVAGRKTEASEEQTTHSEVSEVVVTAQKRTERLIDVPQAVTVVSGEELAKIGAVRFFDFADNVPGLSFNTLGAGMTQITLRGLTTGFWDISSTVALYVDELPFGASGSFASSQRLTLDAALFDLDRVEVLKGPQGTLYGASSIGGLIKYVTKKPDATRFDGQVQTGFSATSQGGPSYNGAGAINIPISTDKLALRASGFYSRDGGFMDNTAQGQKDVNQSDTYGGRADLLFTPSDKLSLRITGFVQNVDRDGEMVADYTFAGEPVNGLNQSRLVDEPYYQRFRSGSATLDYDFGWASLISISSYQTVESVFNWDLSGLFAPLFTRLGFPTSSAGIWERGTTDKFTQELRLSSSGKGRLEWVLGAFYTDEDSEFAYGYASYDAASQKSILNYVSQPSTYEEYAVFGDLTWHFTDKFDITGGVRFAPNRQTYEVISTGPLPIIASAPVAKSDDEVTTYLANARYRFSDRATMYVRYATGYRPGGPNLVYVNPATGQTVGSPKFEADSLDSYEIGFKGETEDRRFGIDAAAFYVEWDNILINVIRNGFGARDNAPDGATVRGGELALTARPLRGLTVTGALAYTDAQMSEANPALGAGKGERLPGVPRFTESLNIDHAFADARWQPTLGMSLRYISDRRASFNGSLGYPQYTLPDYTTVDLRAGLKLGSVSTQLYLRNIFDERGQISALTALGVPARVAIQQPRTIGLVASMSF